MEGARAAKFCRNSRATLILHLVDDRLDFLQWILRHHIRSYLEIMRLQLVYIGHAVPGSRKRPLDRK